MKKNDTQVKKAAQVKWLEKSIDKTWSIC